MKRYLVTGANGLLGQTLVHQLRVRKDIELLATGRGPNRMTDQSGYAYRSVDLTDAAAVQALIREFSPDVLIHTAAMTQLEPCHHDPEACRAINTDAVATLVAACEETGAHLIHVSTDFVFDGESGPYREEDPVNPVSVYGESKLEAEQLVQRMAGQWSIVRTVLVFGLVDDMSRSNLVLWVKRSLEAGTAIKVVSDQVRTATLVDDLADGCIRVAEREKAGIYHISGPDTRSILEMAQEVADFYQLDRSLISPVTSAELNQPARRPPVTGFVLDKARADLDYAPKSFAESLKILDNRFRKLQSEAPGRGA